MVSPHSDDVSRYEKVENLQWFYPYPNQLINTSQLIIEQYNLLMKIGWQKTNKKVYSGEEELMMEVQVEKINLLDVFW